jgi:hypothetical protein
LVVPPLGIVNEDQRRTFAKELYSSLQRHLRSPLKFVLADSAYAPYIAEDNLVQSDGTINIKEAALVGELMNCDYVICSYINSLTPYFPQRIDLRVLSIHTESITPFAEVSGAFDSRDSNISNRFTRYNEENRSPAESEDDLSYKLKSPVAFQRFVTDACSELIARRISL